jgi:hypothetical protein
VVGNRVADGILTACRQKDIGIHIPNQSCPHCGPGRYPQTQLQRSALVEENLKIGLNLLVSILRDSVGMFFFLELFPLQYHKESEAERSHAGRCEAF